MASLLITTNRNNAMFGLAVLLFALAIIIAATQSVSPASAGLLTFASVTTLALFVVVRLRSSRLRSVLTLAFVLRAGIAATGLFILELPDSTDDALRFQAASFELAELSWAELLTNPVTGAYFYSWINAFWAKLSQPSVASMVALNVLAGWLVVVTASTFAVHIFGRRAAVRVALALTIAPTLILYSSVTMREAFIVLLFVGSHAALAQGLIKRSAMLIMVAWTLSFFTVLLHTAMLVPFVVLTMTCLFFLPRFKNAASRRHPWFRTAVIGTILVLSSVGGTYIFLTGAGLEKLTTYGVSSSGLFNALGSQQEYGARSRAAYLEGYTARTPLQAVGQLPLRVFYFLFSPFPWQIENLGDLIAAIDGIAFAIITIIIIRHVMRRSLHPFSVLILILATSAILVLAMTTSNYGTAVRHRAKLLPTLVIVAIGNAPQSLSQSRRMLVTRGDKLIGTTSNASVKPGS